MKTPLFALAALSAAALFGSPSSASPIGDTFQDKHLAAQLESAGLQDPTILRAALELAANSGSKLLYVVRARDARRNREVTGPVTASVQGVPAVPVDSGVFDGVGHERVQGGSLWMVVDPANDTGFVMARWNDEHGRWTYKRTLMTPPPHPTAIRIGPDATQTVPITDGVQTHGYQHGNTMAAGPLMPTIFQHVACFGPIQLTLNGQPFLNPYSGPSAPDWFGSAKVTDGVRDENDGTVRNTTGGIYSPMSPADGATDPDDLELQLIMHDDPLPQGSTTGNFPPRHRFFYWINFERISMSVIQL